MKIITEKGLLRHLNDEEVRVSDNGNSYTGELTFTKTGFNLKIVDGKRKKSIPVSAGNVVELEHFRQLDRMAYFVPYSYHPSQS